jgi:hypothetical protein
MWPSNSGVERGQVSSILGGASRPRRNTSDRNGKGAAVPTTSDSVSENFDKWGHGTMIRHLYEIGDFIRRLRIQARFGELSRAPLELMRVELRAGIAECDWIARPADQWDGGLPLGVGDRNASVQALQDAIAVRDLLFRALSDLNSAVVRAYRRSPSGNTELIIKGAVSRGQRPPLAVRSLAMRAKLFGLQFSLQEGILEDLQAEACAVNS